MNFLFVFQTEVIEPSRVILRDARAKRALELHALRSGMRSAVIVEGQGVAEAHVTDASQTQIVLSLGPRTLGRTLAFTCVVGLSRPQTVKKVLELCASVGVEAIHFVSSENGERSYQSATVFEYENLQEHLLRGVEQSGCMRLPRVSVRSHVRQFLGEHFPRAGSDTATRVQKLFADTKAPPQHTLARISVAGDSPVWVVVGPESGWTEDERALFLERDFQPFSLGSGILRVEHALAFCLGQLLLKQSP